MTESSWVEELLDKKSTARSEPLRLEPLRLNNVDENLFDVPEELANRIKLEFSLLPDDNPIPWSSSIKRNEWENRVSTSYHRAFYELPRKVKLAINNAIGACSRAGIKTVGDLRRTIDDKSKEFSFRDINRPNRETINWLLAPSEKKD